MEINIENICKKSIETKSFSYKLEVMHLLYTLKEFQSMKDIKELDDAIQKILRSC